MHKNRILLIICLYVFSMIGIVVSDQLNAVKIDFVEIYVEFSQFLTG